MARSRSMEEILTVHFLVLVFAYSALSWFVGHQGSHLVAISKGDAELNPALGFLMKLTSSVPVYVGLLVWLGYRTHWYYPLVLFALSFLVRPLVFVSIERALGWDRSAWAISLIGILAIPLITFAMVYLVAMP